MNKILDSRQAQMELMGQASRGINGLLDLLKAEVARGRYRQLINKLREELAKAGLSKEQIEALMNCKNYQDALKFYSLLAEFRTKEDGGDGREGLSILDTKEEFINTLKDCWDSLTEMFERLDAPTEFFTREHIVPILVNVLPWGKGLKFASVLSNEARVALNTENAVKNIATAIGISNEINRFNILYNKKHNNTNSNNRHNGCK